MGVADAARHGRRTISITLELRQTGESLVGRASDGTSPNRDFSGWLGLVGAIDALLVS